MKSELEKRCSALIEALGLGNASDIRSVTPLTGGVASDIAVVDVRGRRICAKFALEKLRVAIDWQAPPDRSAAEYAWLEVAGRAVPGCAPAVYGHDTDANGFAMEFIHGDDVYLWKEALLSGEPSRNEGHKLGEVLGTLHALTAQSSFDRAPFENQADFYALRLEPYLAFVASVHTALATPLRRLIASLQHNDRVLVHGDVSPKNLLFRGGQPVFLDAECATMGDPSFDVSFCLNHLLLKAFHMPDRVEVLRQEGKNLWAAHAAHVTWEDTAALEARICRLLPALMLARVDGKSPVEYLSEPASDRIRDFATRMIEAAPVSLEELLSEVTNAVGEELIEQN